MQSLSYKKWPTLSLANIHKLWRNCPSFCFSCSLASLTEYSLFLVCICWVSASNHWVSLCLFLLGKTAVYNCLAFSIKLQSHHPFGLIKIKLLKSLFNSFFPCLISKGRWITGCSYCAVKIAEKFQSLCKNCGCRATLLTFENRNACLLPCSWASLLSP